MPSSFIGQHSSTEWLPPSGARKVPTVPEMTSISDQCLTEVTLATLPVPTGHTDTMAPDVKKMQTQLAQLLGPHPF